MGGDIVEKDRIYYQNKIVEILEDAENNINNLSFDILLERIQEVLNDYKN